MNKSEKEFSEQSVNIENMSSAMGLTVEQYVNTVSGSTHSAISEQWIANKLGGTRVIGKQLEWDVETPDRKYKKIEVRNICKSEVSFAPSTARGKGRFFEEKTFLHKLESCDSFVFVDLRDRLMSNPKLYEISVEEAMKLYRSGVLNKKASVGRSKFFKIFPFEKYKLEL